MSKSDIHRKCQKLQQFSEFESAKKERKQQQKITTYLQKTCEKRTM